MKILIIEDEKPAREWLRQMIGEFDPNIQVVGELGSIKESLTWLTEQKEPDLILADIQLSDGLSFDVFEQRELRCPLVFVTAYDEYILKALQHNGIDYLLKPIKRPQLFEALRKYQRLKSHFSGDVLSLLKDLKGEDREYRKRFTVKKGTEFLSVPVEEIAFFYTEYKLVFLVGTSGNKYVVDLPLYELEEKLDPKKFFRLNRKYIAGIQSIQKFRPYHKGKLLVDLQPEVSEEVIVSQEKASAFRSWLEQ